MAIFLVCFAVNADDIVLFDLNGDEDVKRRHDSKEQMSDRHLWGRLKRDDKSEHDRVSDVFVQERLDDPDLLVLLALLIRVNLS
jgi:hypothetical protein